MICLAHSQNNLKIDIEEGKISVLVIENPVAMRGFLLELNEQSQGGPGGFILSEDYEPISIGKNLIFVKEPLFVDCNEKRILTKLYQNIVDEEKMHYLIERDNFDKAYLEYLKELCLLSPLPLAYDEKLSLGELLKCAHVLIDHTSGDFVENLWNYMKVMGDLLHIKVFAFANLKSILSEAELDLLYTQCLYEQRTLLLIEPYDTSLRPHEKKCIVDADGCVIYY